MTPRSSDTKPKPQPRVPGPDWTRSAGAPRSLCHALGSEERCGDVRATGGLVARADEILGQGNGEPSQCQFSEGPVPAPRAYQDQKPGTGDQARLPGEAAGLLRVRAWQLRASCADAQVRKPAAASRWDRGRAPAPAPEVTPRVPRRLPPALFAPGATPSSSTFAAMWGCPGAERPGASFSLGTPLRLQVVCRGGGLSLRREHAPTLSQSEGRVSSGHLAFMAICTKVCMSQVS